MARTRMVLKAERVESGATGTAGAGAAGHAAGWLLRSPGVGKVVTLAPRGAWLEAGAVAGVLRILRREMDLVVPEGCRGVVLERMPGGAVGAAGAGAMAGARHPSVAHGDVLIRVGAGVFTGEDAEGVDAGAHGAADAPGVGGAIQGAHDRSDVPAGMIAIRSPTDGLFYRRPSPDLPPYIEEGTSVGKGTVLGLVEVMKCFNQIVYGRDGEIAASGTVAKILAADGSEVRSGQVLVLVKPASAG
jgi:biotin carboxyl carrier protein